MSGMDVVALKGHKKIENNLVFELIKKYGIQEDGVGEAENNPRSKLI